jgi:hypothetical protein
MVLAKVMFEFVEIVKEGVTNASASRANSSFDQTKRRQPEGADAARQSAPLSEQGFERAREGAKQAAVGAGAVAGG